MHIGKGMLKLQRMTKWDVFLRHGVEIVTLILSYPVSEILQVFY